MDGPSQFFFPVPFLLYVWLGWLVGLVLSFLKHNLQHTLTQKFKFLPHTGFELALAIFCRVGWCIIMIVGIFFLQYMNILHDHSLSFP